MRYEEFLKDTYYKLTTRGVAKEDIFIEETDYVRFVFLITHFQSPTRIYNVSWYTEAFLKKGNFRDSEARTKHVLRGRNIELLAFSLTKDRFEIIIKNLEDQVLSVYMHRVLTAYGKYFNTKYKRSGHVFGGPFEATLIKEEDLKLALAEIHKNSTKWSSLKDYKGTNRWGDLLIVPKALQK